MIEVSAGQIYDTVFDLVNERPDFVYEPPGGDYARCYYVHTDEEGNDTPGCIVGHALNRLGVPLNVLKRYEGKSAHAVLRCVATVEGDESDDAARLLLHVQAAQDARMPWGQALSWARASALAPAAL